MNTLLASYKYIYLIALLAVASTYYWSIRYYIASESPGSNELLAGEALTILFSCPAWLGLAILSLVLSRRISRMKVVLGFLPAVLMFLPIIIRAASS